MFVIAARTAAIWMRTSLQSRPSATIFRTDSRWPMARDNRFRTACVFSCTWPWPFAAVGMIVRFVVGIRFVVQVGNVVLMQVRMVVRMLVFHGGTLLIS